MINPLSFDKTTIFHLLLLCCRFLFVSIIFFTFLDEEKSFYFFLQTFIKLILLNQQKLLSLIYYFFLIFTLLFFGSNHVFDCHLFLLLFCKSQFWSHTDFFVLKVTSLFSLLRLFVYFYHSSETGILIFFADHFKPCNYGLNNYYYNYLLSVTIL